MPNWKQELDIANEFQTCDKTIKGIQKLAKLIATKLEELDRYSEDNIEYEKEGLIDTFNDLATDEEATIAAFDSLWKELYNWADHEHTCWINIFS